MPLIANNIIIAGQKVEQENPKSSVSVIATPDPSTPTVNKHALKTKSQYDKEHGVLFVDGKEKKISKQSGYLLDMLTLDD